MSSSKQQPRQLKCSRCRHHGIVVPRKGHMKSCPFLKCECWKCFLVTQRTDIMAVERNLRRAQRQALGGDQRPRGTSGPMCPGAPGPAGSDADAACGPLDLRSRPAARGEHVTGPESKEARPLPGGGGAPSPFSKQSPGQTLLFPFRMSAHYPGSDAPCADVLFSTPWLPPAPAACYDSGLCGPGVLPYFQHVAVRYPPPLEAGPLADPRQVFFAPEASHEGPMSRQHLQPPLPRHSELDTEKLD